MIGDALSALAERLADASADAALAAAQTIAARAAELAPVQSGALRDSIAAVPRDNAAVVTAAVPYAAAVELGSAARAPHPFLLPALSDAPAAEAAAQTLRDAL